jgi:hypothetical protein
VSRTLVLGNDSGRRVVSKGKRQLVGETLRTWDGLPGSVTYRDKNVGPLGTKLPRTVKTCPSVTQTPFRQTPSPARKTPRREVRDTFVSLIQIDKALSCDGAREHPEASLSRPVLLLSLAGSADRRERLDRASCCCCFDDDSTGVSGGTPYLPGGAFGGEPRALNHLRHKQPPTTTVDLCAGAQESKEGEAHDAG